METTFNERVNAEIDFIKMAKETLELPKQALIVLCAESQRKLGLTGSFSILLKDDTKQIQSATKLLKHFDVGVNAKDFYDACIDYGIVEEGRSVGFFLQG